MKLLILTSRYTATRDIIGEDFGRQTRLFSEIKKLGHDVDFYVADYRLHESRNTKLHGINVYIRPFGIFDSIPFVAGFNRLLNSKKYDYVIGTSDPLWGAIGYFFSKRSNKKFVYDLHDNYETYATYKLPFLPQIDEKVIQKSYLVTTVSSSLKDKIRHLRKQGVIVVRNGFDEKLFVPMKKSYCRKSLGLPKDAKLIIYAGSIQRAQGIDKLIEAFEILKKSNINLVLAGRFYGDEENHLDLDKKGIIYLASIQQKKVVMLINSADVAVVPNPVNEFTKYCFPYKVVEYLACNVPIVATDVGDVGIFLGKSKGSLCIPGDAKDLAMKIKQQLANPRIVGRKNVMASTWKNIAIDFIKELKKEAKDNVF